MKSILIFTGSFIFLSAVLQGQTRDPYFWPFETHSIWNTPIGDEARYVHAGIQPALAYGMTIDEDYIHMHPDAPATPVYNSSAGWHTTKSRCDADGDFIYEIPLKRNWEISPGTWDGRTPNAGLAVLMPDGRTIKQNQPFARCVKGGFATTRYLFDDVDLYADGINGAHGGSGLSAIGGAIRMGELVPGGEINHALKINVFAEKNLYFGERKGHRWPAPVADGYASSTRYAGKIPATTMGSLLAIPYHVNLDTFALETEPARILARTMQRYGAYVVDDTAWDVYALITEWSPTGRVAHEFNSVWGFSMMQQSQDHPWARDIRKIMTQLYVVDNNSPHSVGGGGNPLAPLAPEFGRPGNIVPKIALTKNVTEVFAPKGTSIPLAVQAFDVDGSIRKVEFYIDNTLIGTTTSEPYEIEWKTDNPGKFIFTAKAIDNEHGVAVSHGLKINVEPEKALETPVISLLSSEEDNSVILFIETADHTAIRKVDFYDGFHLLGSATENPFRLKLQHPETGRHLLIAKAYGQNQTIGYSEPMQAGFITQDSENPYYHSND
jgi:hypothetical protein